MDSGGEIVVCPDAADFGRRAAEEFVGAAERAIAAAGRFSVALAGGSTPRSLYGLLAEAPWRNRIDWSRCHFFWGDERCVPPDHPDSNYRMARESLLSRVPLANENVHRMAGEKAPDSAAREYEQTLRTFFGVTGSRWPRFDLILLGIGEDGHTASLFPGSEALAESRRLVVAPYVEKLRSHRLTLTLPVINAAAQVMFLVSGESKSSMVGAILNNETNTETLPVKRVNPKSGRLLWLVDQEAAGSLKPMARSAAGTPPKSR